VRRSTAFATAVLAAAALLPAIAGAQKPPKGGTLTLSAAPNPVVAGGSLTLTGKLTAATPADQKISLRLDPFPFDNFANAGDARTNATGDFSLVQRPTANTRYQARMGNDESPIVTVLVRPRVTLRLSDNTPAAGQRVRFAGRVCPEHDGVNVAIQRRSGGRFGTVRRAKLRDIPGSTCSSYRRRIRVGSDGSYRAVIRGHADHARGVSGVRRANVASR
jgi:hypothetical protein